jgi:fatty acid desaturase
MSAPVSRPRAGQSVASTTGDWTSFAEMRKVIADLFVPRPLVYWADLTISACMGWGFAILSWQSFGYDWSYGVAAFAAALAFYRCWSFTHELAHLKRQWIRRGKLRGYETFWHLIAGYPLLSPGFMYHAVHLEHHDAHSYSRENDAEYLPFAVGSIWNIVLYPVVVWMMPPLAFFRFAIVAPLSMLNGRFRRFVMTRLSSAGMVPRHSRALPVGRELREWNWQESIQSCLCIAVFVACLAGRIDWGVLLHWWIIMVMFLTVNYTRALTAHRYLLNRESVSFEDQVFDSVNVTGMPIVTELWAPAGTQYHGLHHLFPGLPYHNLKIAHERLLRVLEPGHPYRGTVVSGLLPGLAALFRSSLAHGRK